MKYGVKITVIDSLDYKEFREICNNIEKLGYDIIIVNNGNAVCTKSGSEGK